MKPSYQSMAPQHDPDSAPIPVLQSPGMREAFERTTKLRRLLEEEFESLRNQDLDRFEALQAGKIALLQAIAGFVDAHHADTEGPDARAWDALIGAMGACQALHRRNEILIDRKREAISGALQTLLGGAAGASTETYDRLGRMSRRPQGRGYDEA